MEKICRISGESFAVTERDLAFYDAVSPVFAGKKYDVPPPTLCPEERQRRRMAFRNLRYLHHRLCDSSGRKIISCFPPESGLTIYHTEEWWSDKWDGLEYGREFDFGRPFFTQFAELYRAVPSYHLFVTHNQNCEFVNGVANCKDCYLSFNIDHCEDCLYITNSAYNVCALDSLSIRNCELCYECVDCANCYNLAFSFRCSGCCDSAFLSHCRNCRSCIACSNLTGKEYCVFNHKVSRLEFETMRERLRSRSSLARLENEARVHQLNYPVKFFFGDSNENFSGDNLSHAKNSFHCFDSFELENCSYCNYVFHANNCMDFSIFGDHSQWIYECIATGMNCSHDLFCMGCWAGSSNNIYCNLVTGCTNCFGCSGLRHKSYCIFNKQYGKDEYEALAAKIIEHMCRTGEWGEFFPAPMSPHALNETVAQEYMPLSEAEARRRGYRWNESLTGTSLPKQTWSQPADTLADDDVEAGQIFDCSQCGKAYKIIAQELRSHRKINLPLPAACPECRHRSRFERRPVYRLWSRRCAKCGTAIESAYAPDRPEKVFCQECFLRSLD